MIVKDFIIKLSEHVIQIVNDNFDFVAAKKRTGISHGGDTQFSIDEVAEEAVYEYLKTKGSEYAYYSEDRRLITFQENPRYVLIIDPIDGTRGAAANLECCCFSIAVAPFFPEVTIQEVEFGLLYEFKSKNMFFAEKNGPLVVKGAEIRRSSNVMTDQMFWSMEFNGHPSRIITFALGDLIDSSANRGGVFIFNSSTFSISRIFTGQLDAYIDIGNRITRENPHTHEAFRRVGNGKFLHLFPYDIAAAVFLAQKAGVAITDAFGESLGKTKLLDISPENLQSCVAAANWELHREILERIRWVKDESDFEKIRQLEKNL